MLLVFNDYMVVSLKIKILFLARKSILYLLLSYKVSNVSKSQIQSLMFLIFKFLGMTLQDVLHAIDHLPNVKKVTKVSDEKFNHLDFMWAIDAKQLVYDDIIATLHSLTTDRATQDQQLSFLANEASV